MNKRILSLMLCFAMLAAMMAIAVPMSAAADGEENKVSIELPYKLNVEKTGEMDPPEETFRFAIGDFGAPNEHTIVRDTIDTDGERSYDGMFVFTIDQSFCGNLSEGFVFSQVKGYAEGWTYDETRYYAMPIFADNYDKVVGWTFFKLDGDERLSQENMVEELILTNSYYAMKPVVPPSDPETPPAPQKPEAFTDPETPPAPRKPESPKTSDGGMMGLWLALLFVSGISLAGNTLYSRKKRANDR